MVCLILGYSALYRMKEFSLLPGAWPTEILGFAYGILAASHTELIKRWIGGRWLRNTLLWLSLSLILGVSYLKYKPVEFFGDYCLKILLGMAILSFMFRFLFRFRLGNKINAFLSNISYEVYILHRSVFSLLTWLGGPDFNSGAFVVASIALTIALAYLLHRLTHLLKIA